MRTESLILRCYVRPDAARKRWMAHCVDLDLWASGTTLAEAKQSLHDAIYGYLETVLESDDEQSVSSLLQRRSPLRYLLYWRLAALLSRIAPSKKDPPNHTQAYDCSPRQSRGVSKEGLAGKDNINARTAPEHQSTVRSQSDATPNFSILE